MAITSIFHYLKYAFRWNMGNQEVHFGSRLDILLLTLQASHGYIPKTYPIKLKGGVMKENYFFS